MEPLQLQKQISTRTAEEPNRNEPIRGSLPSFWNRCESMRTTGTLRNLQMFFHEMWFVCSESLEELGKGHLAKTHL